VVALLRVPSRRQRHVGIFEEEKRRRGRGRGGNMSAEGGLHGLPTQ